VRELVAVAAKSMGYDPDKVHVSTARKPFEAGGMMWMTGGEAYTTSGQAHPKGDIWLYTTVKEAKNHETNITPILAHEIQHQRWAAVKAAYLDESLRIENDQRAAEKAVGTYRKVGPMKPDGNVREQYADQYPVYAAIHPTFHEPDWEEWPKADGVSDYSRAYWKDYDDHKHENGSIFNYGYRAIDESMAEMAKNEFHAGASKPYLNPDAPRTGNPLDPDKHSSTGGGKVFRDLYAAIKKVYPTLKKS
jgi:hypothetical protein